MDLPKILLTGLFFCFFCFFWFSSSFWTVGLGTPKNLEKNDENQKTKKKQSGIDLLQILLTGLFFFVSFWFSLTFWTYGKVEMKKGKKHEKTKHEKTKHAKTQRSQRPFL